MTEMTAKERTKGTMSNRFGYQGNEETRHLSRYERRKRELQRQENARLAAEQAPAIDIPALKRKLKSKPAKPIKPTERASRLGGPLPSDFHYGFYPDED
jgi:hypothetical protein